MTREEKLGLLILLEEKERRRSITSLYSFVRNAWATVEPETKFVDGPHIKAMCDHLQATFEGRIRNLLINVPPRHAKSTITSVMFPAWVWLRRPDLRFIYASYSYTVAKRDSVKCRRLVESDWYRKKFDIKWRLAKDQNEKMSFENNRTGMRMATSVGGSITGMGGDFLVCDDPHNVVDAYSETKLENSIVWFNEAFSTRMNDPKHAVKIVIMQRLVEGDLSGMLLEQGGWELLKLPAEYEGEKNPTSLGWEDWRNEPGELLWPERFGIEELNDWKKFLGVAAPGQLQQRPSALDGDIIKKQWLKFYDVLPDSFEDLILVADLSYKEGESNDFTVIECWGRVGSDVYLVDQIRERIGFTDQVLALKSMASKYPEAFTKIIEEHANGAAIISLLQNEMLGLDPYKPKTQKGARLAAVSGLYAAGNVHYPNPNLCPWIVDNISELLAMSIDGSKAKHDDTVDCASMALQHLGRFGSTMAAMQALGRL